jgi:hypothetical protein
LLAQVTSQLQAREQSTVSHALTAGQLAVSLPVPPVIIEQLASPLHVRLQLAELPHAMVP